MFANTDHVQWISMGFAFLLNAVGFIQISKLKIRKDHHLPKWTNSWTLKRNAYWVLIAVIFTWSTVLDAYFPIDTHVVLHIKSYLLAFPVCLLDLYFSDTRSTGVQWSILKGIAIWLSSNILRQCMMDLYQGHHVPTLIVQGMSLQTCMTEFVRLTLALAAIAFFSDIVFSPVHRLSHHIYYQENHKKHHAFTNKLTSLVLYHSTSLDDILMALCSTTTGPFAYYVLATFLMPHTNPFSNVTMFFMVLMTHLSHAHDIRCARLIAPLPDSLNFAAYHYVHHLSPKHNFGLTEPSDLLWDWILGVQTIRKLDEIKLETS